MSETFEFLLKRRDERSRIRIKINKTEQKKLEKGGIKKYQAVHRSQKQMRDSFLNFYSIWTNPDCRDDDDTLLL